MSGASSMMKNSAFSSLLSPSPAIATEKLMGSSNYMSWSKAVELWCIGLGLQNHLTTKPQDMEAKDKDQWLKIDALLLSLL